MYLVHVKNVSANLPLPCKNKSKLIIPWTFPLCLNAHRHVQATNRGNIPAGHTSTDTLIIPQVCSQSTTSENNMWEPRCSTPEPAWTSSSHLHTPHAKYLRPLQSVFMNVQPPHLTLFFRYLPRSLKRWEVSHDRDQSTSPGSLTFYTQCFAIPLMHSQCLLLLPFWRMLNVEQCLKK